MTYDNLYFKKYKETGKLTSITQKSLFEDYISLKDKVIDFGCGGGWLLGNIVCEEKIGIEPNKNAWETIKLNNVKPVKQTSEIKDEWADVIISNHVLEHVLNPFEELKILYKKLKKGGTVIFIVPHELKGKYNFNDVNNHLYTWNKQCLGNLFNAVGFKILSVGTIKRAWPTYFPVLLRKYLGLYLFNFICRLNALIFRKIYQIKIVAKKE